MLLPMIFVALTVSSCGKPSDAGDGPHTVRIIASSGNGYSLQNVTVRTLTNLEHMEGELSAILGDASLNADANIEEFISPNSRDNIYLDKGKQVRLDFENKAGVIHPKNFDSMAMLAMYYNYEKTFTYWQDNLGLDVDDFGHLRMLYAPRIKRELSGGSFEGTVKVNAAFLPGPRDFFFFKTSPIELLPINMNFGVMAHEFSHAVFDYKFAKKDAAFYNTEQLDSEVRLRAINEGIADYFSFMVTGRVEEFGDSLESLKDYRTLPVFWTLSSLSGSGCKSEAYCEGSLLASALYEIAITDGQDILEVGKIVYESLEGFGTDWQELKETSDFDYHVILNRILETASSQNADLSLFCSKFVKYFDNDDLIGRLQKCNS